MAKTIPKLAIGTLAGGIVIAVIAAAWLHWRRTARSQPALHGALATTAPSAATRPTTAPRPPVAETFLDVVRATYAGFPATQPLSTPLELSQAAHLVLRAPIYLGDPPRREMWITWPTAPPTAQALADAVNDQLDLDVHLVRERIVFVHWMPIADGAWPPDIICKRGPAEFEVISASFGRQKLPRRDYRWEHAMSWNEQVAVPTGRGISILHFGPKIEEIYHELAPPAAKNVSEPQMLFDARGLIAWIPWEAGKTGSRGAAQFDAPADNADSTAASPPPKWTDLTPDNGWPARLLHLVPLLDGSVLMLAVDDHNQVHLDFNTLSQEPVKQQDIEKWVDQLSDPDPKQREQAYDTLSQYGSGIWPILERLLKDQGPEARSRMRQLLKQKIAPTLNGMILLGNKSLKLAARLKDGGTVFYAQAGVAIPNPDDPDAGPAYRAPAWISIRPGRAIELLPEALTAELTPGQSKIYVNGNDWIISDPAHGPRRFVGNGFVTLLRKNERRYDELVGIDRRGRWLFQSGASAATSTTRPASGAAATGTLILDPWLADPTPRLPVWVFDTADTVGWTRAGWPVAKKVSAYALHEKDWQALGESERIFTRADEVPPPQLPPATRAAETHPATTQPATTQSHAAPLLVDKDGTAYYGGLRRLLKVTSSGQEVDWPLPAITSGRGPAWLVRANDGRLYLFNEPGRVVRLKPTPGQSEPFILEKIFTHRIPSVERPTRIWLDPAGRIIMAWDNRLAIFFPRGFIPPAIAEKMIAEPGEDSDQ